MSRRPLLQRPEEFDPEGVPSALRARAQWICWRCECRNGKWLKLPVDAGTGRPANTADPSTWHTFEEALEGWRTIPGVSGLGYVFSEDDPFTGVDLDECLTPGGLTPQAEAIIRELASYTEISPSGLGVKVIIEGKKPAGWEQRRRPPKQPWIELYDRTQYFAITGRLLPGSRSVVEPRGAELANLCRRLWPRAAPRPDTKAPVPASTDAELLNRMFAAKNGAGTRRLWQGDLSEYGGDHSAADMALSARLAFWTCCDAERMDRLFRCSGLMRGKWDERRGETTYGAMTIAKAIAGCTQTCSSGGGRRQRTERAIGASDRPAPATAIHLGGGSTLNLGDTDPATGKLVLAPKAGFPSALAFIREFHELAGCRTILARHGSLYVWKDNCYAPIEDGALLKVIQQWLHRAVRPRCGKAGIELVPFQSNSADAKSVLDSIRFEVHMDPQLPIPSWREGSAAPCPASEILACANTNVHLPTGELIAPTPQLLTFDALPVNFDANAPEPLEWLAFLNEVFGGDQESIEVLRMWFGYCLRADRSQEKMLLIVGPTRSGKGTIARVMEALLGPERVAAPTTTSLGTQFGLQCLLGKLLAIVHDARVSRERAANLLESILTISGRGSIEVDRKHSAPVTAALGVRFMVLSNEVPEFADPSGAIASRFILLRLTKSFLGKEDPDLGDRLVAELPGILPWAIEGARMLRSSGRFPEPMASATIRTELIERSAPVAAFVRQRCVRHPDARVPIRDLYDAWTAWQAERGTVPGTIQDFGKAVRAVDPAIDAGTGTDDRRFYRGIALLEDLR